MKIRSDNAVALQTLSASPASLSAIKQLQPMQPMVQTEAIHQRDLFFSLRSVRARVESYLKTREDALFTPSLGQPQYLAFMFNPKSMLDADYFILAFWDELAQRYQQETAKQPDSPFKQAAMALMAKKRQEQVDAEAEQLEDSVFEEVLVPVGPQDDAQGDADSDGNPDKHHDQEPDTAKAESAQDEGDVDEDEKQITSTAVVEDESERIKECASTNQDSAKPCAHRLSTFHIRWLAVNVKNRIPMPLQVMASSDDRLSENDLKEVGLKRLRYAYDPESLECYPEDIFAQKQIEKAYYNGTRNLLQSLGKLIPAKNPLGLSIDEDATIWLGTRFKWTVGSYHKDGQGNYLQMYDLVRLPNGVLGTVQLEHALNKVPFVSYENPFSKKLLKDAMIAAVEKQEAQGYLLVG